MPDINFNFLPEQQEKFNLIYDETKKLHPHLTKDDIMRERTKVLIAYTVINGDKPLIEKEQNDNSTFTEI
jgi:hypothetical protein